MDYNPLFNRFEATHVFAEAGDYTVSFVTRDRAGNDSLPSQSKFSPFDPDEYEEDDTAASATEYMFSDSPEDFPSTQVHNSTMPATPTG